MAGFPISGSAKTAICMRSFKCRARFPSIVPLSSATFPQTKATYSLSVVFASNCLAKCVIAASVLAITNKPEVSLSIRCTNPGRSLLFIGKFSK